MIPFPYESPPRLSALPAPQRWMPEVGETCEVSQYDAGPWYQRTVTAIVQGDVYQFRTLNGGRWRRARKIERMSTPDMTPVDTGPVIAPMIDIDGWKPWAGGECPVSPDVRVSVRCRNGGESAPMRPCNWYWKHDGDSSDIIAYKVIP